MASDGQDDKYADWLTPAAAVDLLTAAFGNDSQNHHAKQTLLDGLQAGIVLAVAEISKVKNGRTTGYDTIPANHWPEIDTNSSLWTTTHVTYRYTDGTAMSGYREVSRFGIRFDPSGVNTLLPPVSKRNETQPGKSPSPNPNPVKHAGGAPRKEWWDDFWIEICRQIWENGPPKSQADLQRAMHQWVENNGGDVGDTTIKKAAKKLFDAWNLHEGKN